MLVLGLASAASAQPPADKQYQIRPRTEAFVKSQTLAADPNDDDLRKLRKARLNAALNEMFGRTLDFTRDGSRVDHLLDSALRLLEAELGYYERAEDRARVLEEHLGISRELTAIIEGPHQSRAGLGGAPGVRSLLPIQHRACTRESPSRDGPLSPWPDYPDTTHSTTRLAATPLWDSFVEGQQPVQVLVARQDRPYFALTTTNSEFNEFAGASRPVRLSLSVRPEGGALPP